MRPFQLHGSLGVRSGDFGSATQEPRPQWIALAVATAFVVVGSALAIGGVHLPVLIVLAAVTAAGATFALTGRPAMGVPWPAVVAVVLALATLVQTIPLPVSWIATIAPDNADVWTHAFIGGKPPSWIPLSLDPGASTVEALKWLIYAGVFVCGARVASSLGLTTALTIVFGATVATALATIGHGLVDATKVWGVYKPSFELTRWHIGPLINSNNLAGYMNLGALVGFGLLLKRRRGLPLWLIAIGLALVVGTEIISASRGALLALFGGIVVLAFVSLRYQRTSERSRRQPLLLLASVIAGGVLLALLGGDRSVWLKLYDGNLEKLTMLVWVKPLIVEHPWFGIGRGAFESVFPAYRTSIGNRIYTHPENIVAQWIAEWGIPLSIGAAVAFAATLRSPPQRRDRSLRTATQIGVGLVLLQNLVDLGLEVPAIAIAVAFALGAIWGGRRPSDFRLRDQEKESWVKPAAIGAPLAIVLVGIAAIVRGGPSVSDDRDELHAQFGAIDPIRRSEVASLRDEIRSMTLRHPAEPYFPLIGAAVAFAARDSDPLPWLQRALERSPANGRAHLLLAEILGGRRAKGQEMLELRLAVGDEPSLAFGAAQVALKATRDRALLEQSVPEGAAGIAMLDALADGADRAGEATLQVELDAATIARDPLHPGAHTRAARRMVAAERADPKSCPAASSCDAAFNAHVATIATRSPGMSTATVLRGQMMAARGDAIHADRVLARECPTFDDRASCAVERAQIASTLSGQAPLEAATTDLLSNWCVDAKNCAAAATLVAGLRAQRGEWGAAAGLYGRAVQEAPTEAGYRALGDAASHAGLHVQAAEALERAAALRAQPDAALSEAIARERSLSQTGLLPR